MVEVVALTSLPAYPRTVAMMVANLAVVEEYVLARTPPAQTVQGRIPCKLVCGHARGWKHCQLAAAHFLRCHP